MSQETQAWAKQQRTGDPVTKAVLAELCNWAKPTGIVDFLSLQMIADAVEVSKRTVIRHLDKLEHELKLIRRLPRFRPDGGYGANGFDLIGYEAPAPGTAPRPARDRARKPAPPSDSLSPAPGDNPSRASDTDVTYPSDTGVTPLGDKINPPLTPLKGGVPPLGSDHLQKTQMNDGEDGKLHPLPDAWEPPKPDDLQPEARALVRQWPPGAYAVYAANFRNHWLDRGAKNRRKSNWNGAFANWLVRVHSEVMLAAKRGASFEACAPFAAGQVKAQEPVSEKVSETAFSDTVHGLIAGRIGDTAWRHWIKPCAIIARPEHADVTIVAPSAFMASHLGKEFSSVIEAALMETETRGFRLRFVASGGRNGRTDGGEGGGKEEGESEGREEGIAGQRPSPDPSGGHPARAAGAGAL